MKQLYVLRHAKSDWDEPGLPDRDRGLNRRGRRAAPAMGRALSRLLAPMPLDVSAARRAQLTLSGLCAGWPALEGLEHRTHEALYTFDMADLLAWLARGDEREVGCGARALVAHGKQQGDGRESQPYPVFLLGHNPACTDLVNFLAGRQVLDNLPTAGFVSLQLDIDRWRDLRQGCGSLETTLFPRQLEHP